jgi:hypothetical protein
MMKFRLANSVKIARTILRITRRLLLFQLILIKAARADI